MFLVLLSQLSERGREVAIHCFRSAMNENGLCAHNSTIDFYLIDHLNFQCTLVLTNWKWSLFIEFSNKNGLPLKMDCTVGRLMYYLADKSVSFGSIDCLLNVCNARESLPATEITQSKQMDHENVDIGLEFGFNVGKHCERVWSKPFVSCIWIFFLSFKLLGFSIEHRTCWNWREIPGIDQHFHGYYTEKLWFSLTGWVEYLLKSAQNCAAKHTLIDFQFSNEYANNIHCDQSFSTSYCFPNDWTNKPHSANACRFKSNLCNPKNNLMFDQ